MPECRHVSVPTNRSSRTLRYPQDRLGIAHGLVNASNPVTIAQGIAGTTILAAKAVGFLLLQGARADCVVELAFIAPEKSEYFQGQLDAGNTQFTQAFNDKVAQLRACVHNMSPEELVEGVAQLVTELALTPVAARVYFKAAGKVASAGKAFASERFNKALASLNRTKQYVEGAEEAVAGSAEIAEGAGGEASTQQEKSKYWHQDYVDNLDDMQIILGAKSSGKGASTLGSATRANALRAGEAWVGNGATPIYDGENLIGYCSSDKLRTFRLHYKKRDGMVRGNFQEFIVDPARNNSVTEIKNVHIDILS